MVDARYAFLNLVTLPARPAAGTGQQLGRVPQEVGRNLSPRGRWNNQQTGGGEIRFVTEAPHFCLHLSSLEGDAEVLVYQGESLVTTGWLQPGQQLCLHVYGAENALKIDPAHLSVGSRFAARLWRVVLSGYRPVFHELDTFGWASRAPRPDEVPERIWLAYGSSITAGCAAPRIDLTYTQLAARRLGVDVLNMGFGGACHCEPELADFFATELPWDFATLELGVNMRDLYEPDVFAQRAGYVIDRLLSAKPQARIVLITPFITGAEVEVPMPVIMQRQRAFEAWMRQRVQAGPVDRLHLIEGHALLAELHALNGDMVHPGGYGHTLIAERLSVRLAAIGLPTPTSKG